jgi:hypothetical protein
MTWNPVATDRVSAHPAIQPGKPTQTARVESFHGRLRERCLSVLVSEPFSMPDARSKLCLAKIETELYRRIKWLRHRCVPGLSSITVTAVPDQTSDRGATPSVRGPRITRFKQLQQLLCDSRVAVVQATDTRFRNYRAAAHARLSSTRPLFLQGQMSSVVVIVRHVLQKKSL